MAENDKGTPKKLDRRGFLGKLLGNAALVATGGAAGGALLGAGRGDTVWQIDPEKCTQCERCATQCVLDPSAVKAVHAYDVCFYCNLCGGFHQPGSIENTAAEHQLCPTSAITRTFIENPFYKYDIEEEKCIGCGICVKGCNTDGNGSLFLQIRHDRCVNCNECMIAKMCPSDAIQRVPANDPYILKGRQGKKPVKELKPYVAPKKEGEPPAADEQGEA